MAKRKGAVKFVETDMSRIFECHLFIVSVSDTRTGLIEAYKAAKTSLKSPFLVAMVVTAIRIRLMQLNKDNTYFYSQEI